MLGSGRHACSYGARVPDISDDIVQGNALSAFVQQSKIALSTGITLLSCKTYPMRSLVVVNRNTKAFEVKAPKHVLAPVVTSLGGSAKPFRGLGVIATCALAGIKEIA